MQGHSFGSSVKCSYLEIKSEIFVLAALRMVAAWQGTMDDLVVPLNQEQQSSGSTPWSDTNQRGTHGIMAIDEIRYLWSWWSCGRERACPPAYS